VIRIRIADRTDVKVALLRSINLGRHKKVAMYDLRAVSTELGFSDVRSFLQTGNVIFRSQSRATQLEGLLEREVDKRLGLQTDFFFRNADEWTSVLSHNPFRDEARRDPAHVVVVFLKDAPDANQVKALQAAITGRERVAAHGKHAYLVYPDGIGRSRVTSSLIERTLATRGAGRNWNTVRKIAELL
jgi:uncharacterized protein (DUF1697 family)